MFVIVFVCVAALSVPDVPVDSSDRGAVSSGHLETLQGLMLKLLPRYWSTQV